MIEVSQDIRQTAIQALRHIPGASRRALVNGLNRAVRAAKTEAYRTVVDTYAVLAGAFLDTVHVTEARKDRLVATVRSRGETTKLDAYPHTPTQPGTGGRGKPPLRAAIRRRRTMTPVPGAFVIPSATKGPIVVWRSRADDIRRVPALAIPFMMTSEDVYERIERRAGEVLEERVAHEIAYELDKAARRAS